MNVNGINNGSYMPVQKRESPKTGNTAPGFQNSFNGVHTLVMGGDRRGKALCASAE